MPYVMQAERRMRIKLTNIFVSDQERALRFYTDFLGFRKKSDITAGKFRWLTVVSPEDPDGTQLQLGPNDNPPAKTFQEAMFKQGIYAANFFVEDVQKEYERIRKLGARFTMEPTKTPCSMIAILDDTCGNLIQLTQLT